MKYLFIAILLSVSVSSFSQKIDWDRKSWLNFNDLFDTSFTGKRFSHDSVYRGFVTPHSPNFSIIRYISKPKITIHGDTAIVNEDAIKYIKLEYRKKIIKLQ